MMEVPSQLNEALLNRIASFIDLATRDTPLSPEETNQLEALSQEFANDFGITEETVKSALQEELDRRGISDEDLFAMPGKERDDIFESVKQSLEAELEGHIPSLGVDIDHEEEIIARYQSAFNEIVFEDQEKVDALEEEISNLDTRIIIAEQSVEQLNPDQVSLDPDIMSPEEQAEAYQKARQDLADLKCAREAKGVEREALLDHQEKAIELVGSGDRPADEYLDELRQNADAYGLDKAQIEGASEVDDTVQNESKTDTSRSDSTETGEDTTSDNDTQEHHSTTEDPKEEQIRAKLQDVFGTDADSQYEKLKSVYKDDSDKLSKTVNFVKQWGEKNPDGDVSKILDAKIDYDTSKDRLEDLSTRTKFRNTFTVAERLNIDLAAYKTGLPGVSGKPVCGGDIALDILELTRTNIFESIFEIMIYDIFEKVAPANVDAVDADVTADKKDAAADATKESPDQNPPAADLEHDPNKDTEAHQDDVEAKLETLNSHVDSKLETISNLKESVDGDRQVFGDTDRAQPLEAQSEAYGQVISEYQEIQQQLDALDGAALEEQAEAVYDLEDKIANADAHAEEAVQNHISDKLDAVADDLAAVKPTLENSQDPAADRAIDRIDAAERVLSSDLGTEQKIDALGRAVGAVSDVEEIDRSDVSALAADLDEAGDIDDTTRKGLSVEEIKEELLKALDQGPDGTFSMADYIKDNSDKVDPDRFAVACKEAIKEKISDNNLKDDLDEDLQERISDVVSDCIDTFTQLSDDPILAQDMACECLETIFSSDDTVDQKELDSILNGVIDNRELEIDGLPSTVDSLEKSVDDLEARLQDMDRFEAIDVKSLLTDTFGEMRDVLGAEKPDNVDLSDNLDLSVDSVDAGVEAEIDSAGAEEAVEAVLLG